MADKNFKTDPFKAPLARVSYAFNLFKPRKNTRDNGEEYENYQCTLIFPNNDLGPLKTALAACVIGQWGEGGKEKFKNELIRNPILSGTGKEARNKQTGEINPGLGEGVSFLRVASSRKPPIVDERVLPIYDQADLPSGSWGYPVINAYAWTNAKGGMGVSFGIESFQRIKKATGEDILGGESGVDPSKFFEAVKSDDTAPVGDASDLFL